MASTPKNTSLCPQSGHRAENSLSLSLLISRMSHHIPETHLVCLHLRHANVRKTLGMILAIFYRTRRDRKASPADPLKGTFPADWIKYGHE
jgi:hypothetical protein